MRAELRPTLLQNIISNNITYLLTSADTADPPHTPEKLGSSQSRCAIALIVGLAALNWGLVGALDTNLLVDILNLDPSTVDTAYTLTGLAAAVSLYNIVVGEVIG